MTRNKRYEAHYDALSAHRIAIADGQRKVCTLTQDAYGPEPLTWAQGQQPKVWAWISWTEGPATKIPCRAAAWNDRIVIVEWEAMGGRRSNVVWRNAVTVRNDETPPSRSWGAFIMSGSGDGRDAGVAVRGRPDAEHGTGV